MPLRIRSLAYKNRFRSRIIALLQTGPKDARMQVEKQKLPPGWAQTRLRKLAEHYDSQSEDEQAAEHERVFHAQGHTVMVVPTELVPEIRRVIARNRTA